MDLPGYTHSGTDITEPGALLDIMAAETLATGIPTFVDWYRACHKV